MKSESGRLSVDCQRATSEAKEAKGLVQALTQEKQDAEMRSDEQ